MDVISYFDVHWPFYLDRKLWERYVLHYISRMRTLMALKIVW